MSGSKSCPPRRMRRRGKKSVCPSRVNRARAKRKRRNRKRPSRRRRRALDRPGPLGDNSRLMHLPRALLALVFLFSGLARAAEKTAVEKTAADSVESAAKPPSREESLQRAGVK